MAELVDALASGASSLRGVEVQVLFWAPFAITMVYHIVQNAPLISFLKYLQNTSRILGGVYLENDCRNAY